MMPLTTSTSHALAAAGDLARRARRHMIGGMHKNSAAMTNHTSVRLSGQ